MLLVMADIAMQAERIFARALLLDPACPAAAALHARFLIAVRRQTGVYTATHPRAARAAAAGKPRGRAGDA